jgi:hypothetical protein
MNNKHLLSIFLVGGIPGLAATVESAARIFAPVIGGAFGALVRAGVYVYVFIRIYNHPTVFTLKQETVPVRVSTDN